MTRALLIDSKVPKFFWPEALATSVYTLNRLPTKGLDRKTPIQVLSAHTELPLPLTLDPKIFGCSVFIHIPKIERTKFSPCAIKGVFVGYGVHQKGYRCYDPKSKRMFVTMNCDFVENEYFYHQLSSQGEKEPKTEIDPLSVLPNPIINPSPSPNPGHEPSPDREENPTEEVSITAEPITDTPVESIKISDIVAVQSPTDISEVREAADPSEIRWVETNHDHSKEPEASTSGQQRVLPPRSTRGVPPKKYSPDWKGRKTQYSIVNSVKAQMTEMAKVFEAALYEEDIPHSVEEAMKHKH